MPRTSSTGGASPSWAPRDPELCARRRRRCRHEAVKASGRTVAQRVCRNIATRIAAPEAPLAPLKTMLDPRALARELLAFNTINPPGMERACARHLGEMLADAGFRVAYHEFAESRTSLIAQIGGDAARPPICFTGHIDTVPLGHAHWTRDAFAGETDGDRLYGRGATDMKSGIAAFVAAAIQPAPHL